MIHTARTNSPSNSNRKMKMAALSSRGVSIIEVAIGIPVFLSLVIGVVYLTYILVAKSALNRAAAIAMAQTEVDPVLAETISELSLNGASVLPADPNTCTADDALLSDTSKGAFCAAVLKIRELAIRSATAGFIGPNEESNRFVHLTDDPIHFILPTPAANESLVRAFKNAPVVIEMRAEVKSLLPAMSTIPLRAAVTGYKEISAATSHTVQVDCNGNPIGSSNYWKSTSPCFCDKEQDLVWDSTTRSCTNCAEDMTAKFFDRNRNYVPIPFNDEAHARKGVSGYLTQCYCPSDAYCMGKLGVGGFSDSTATGSNYCRCGCSTANGFVTSADKKSCECLPAPSFNGANGFHVEFSSAAGAVVMGYPWCSCKYMLPPVFNWGGPLSARELSYYDCKWLFPAAATNVTAKPCGCTCMACPAGATTITNDPLTSPDNCACHCTDPLKELVFDQQGGSSCQCKNPPTCVAPQVLNTSTCACSCSPMTCGSYGHPNSTTCMCDCIDGTSSATACPAPTSNG